MDTEQTGRNGLCECAEQGDCMKTQHTPGTWIADWATGMSNGSPQVVEYFVRVDGDDIAIASIVLDPATGQPSEANARLIAAAPELLEALIDLLHQAKLSEDEGGWDFEQARAAIAKATGETP